MFVASYSIIWTLIVPMSIPDHWDTAQTLLSKRYFYHILATVIIASHITLVFESLRRKKEWQKPGKGFEEDKSKQICYGDRVRIIHNSTGMALHSHELNYCYPGSSGQQQVTAYDGYDINDYWIVKSRHGNINQMNIGQAIPTGSIIRLEHMSTTRNLHSHIGRPSPITAQQEVTAFGKDGEGDTNDNWKLSLIDSDIWRENQIFRLIHVKINMVLHSHAGQIHDEYTAVQQEVTCYSDRDQNDLWKAIIID